MTPTVLPPSCRPGRDVLPVEVIVEVGGWEHECCGSAVERGDSVSFTCIRHPEPDGRVRLIESHHDLGADERVRGRVLDIHVVEEVGVTRPVLRLPRGAALRGSDPDDAGSCKTPGPLRQPRRAAPTSSSRS